MKTYSFFMMAGLILVSACTENILDLEKDVVALNSQKEIAAPENAGTDSLESVREIIPIEPDSALVELLKKKAQTRANPASQATRLSDNLYAIRDIPVVIQTRDNYYNGNNQLWATSGRNSSVAIIMGNVQEPEKYYQFYIKVPPAHVGIPYQIYSLNYDTPVAAGAFADRPDEKIIYVMSSSSTTSLAASWDIFPSSNAGYVVIQSQALIGQGDSGFWSDIFYYVCESQGFLYPVTFGKYAQKSTQDFILNPVPSFTLDNIQYVNAYTAKVTKRADVSITRSHTNEYSSIKSHIMSFDSIAYEPSSFNEDRQGIRFKIAGLDGTFKRPTVSNGEISLTPSENAIKDAKYTSYESIANSLSAKLPLNAPARSKLTITYFLATYDVEVEYEAKLVYTNPDNDSDRREVTLTGVWSGTIHVDEKTDPIIRETNLDTNAMRAMRCSIKNVTMQNPLNF